MIIFKKTYIYKFKTCFFFLPFILQFILDNMELIHPKKTTDKEISDPVVRNESRRYSARTRLAFLPDEVIAKSWYFRFLTFIYHYIFFYFHGFESKNI